MKSPTAAAVVSGTTVAADSAQPVSVLVSGTVVEAGNRPVAKANVECMGNKVTCVAPGTQVISQDGPDDGVNTQANGRYAMVLSAPAGSTSVMLMAHALKYELQMQEVKFPDAGCTADQARCALTVNFTLRDQEQ